MEKLIAYEKISFNFFINIQQTIDANRRSVSFYFGAFITRLNLRNILLRPTDINRLDLHVFRSKPQILNNQHPKSGLLRIRT